MRHTRLLGLAAVILLLADAIFGYVLIKKYFYPYSLDAWSYIVQSSDAISLWTGRVTWLVLISFYICLPFILGKSFDLSDPAKLVQRCVNAVKQSLTKKHFSLSLLAIDLIIFGTFAHLYVTAPHAPPLPAGRMVLWEDTENQDSKTIYAVTPQNILVYDPSSPSGVLQPQENFPYDKPSNLQYLAVSLDRKRIYATDYDQEVVHIIDMTQRQKAPQQLTVGRMASALAQSADGKKLYVGVIGPVPEGAIDVFRTDTLQQVGRIGNIGCPVGLSAPANAPLLFVATQCGGGYDPLYVIDTRSDKVVDTIQGFAVGASVVATPDGKTAFVSTGDKLKILSGYGTAKQIISDIRVPVSTLAVTQDGATLLVGTPPGIRALNVATMHWCSNDITLETEPSAIAIGKDGTVAAMMPRRIFLTDMKAIECRS